MAKNNNSIGTRIKRELVSVVMERAQSFDTGKMMNTMGEHEAVVYDDVAEIHNVAYVNREEVALTMDVFEPKNLKGTELPVIIAVHGGGLFMGDRSLERPYCRMLAHKGYLVFSLEYRLAPKAKLSQQLDDVCAGMDHVGKLLVNYDVDFERIFLVADSAGAYLACYVSAMHKSPKLQDAIGYKASKMVYSAVGFICGMFYTQDVLKDQIYGDKRDDEQFLKYMDIEHPEIIDNIPPAFLITSCGDSFNNYSLKFNKALRRRGKSSRLVYVGDEELFHVFPITNPEHPRSVEVTDKMLEWFEEQSAIRHETFKKEEALRDREAKVEIRRQKVWEVIRDKRSFDEIFLSKTAITDCYRHYTYGQMFAEWEKYAAAFSELGICKENGSRVALCGMMSAEPIFALFGLNMTGAAVSLYALEDFLYKDYLKDLLKREQITDIIISDMMISYELRQELETIKETFGIRNIIFLHSRLGGVVTGPAELTCNEYNYHNLKLRKDSVFMEDLIHKYGDSPIKYDTSKGNSLFLITHSNGSDESTMFTDDMINKMLTAKDNQLRSYIKEYNGATPVNVMQLMDLDSIASFVLQIGAVFARGDSLVTSFFGFMHPKFARAIDYLSVDALVLTKEMLDKWIERRDGWEIDFSSLKTVVVIGKDISEKIINDYNDFFALHGSKGDIVTVCRAELSQGTNDFTTNPFYTMFWPYSMSTPKKEKEKRSMMPQVPESVTKAIMKYGNRITGISKGRKWIDYDFEE